MVFLKKGDFCHRAIWKKHSERAGDEKATRAKRGERAWLDFFFLGDDGRSESRSFFQERESRKEYMLNMLMNSDENPM